MSFFSSRQYYIFSEILLFKNHPAYHWSTLWPLEVWVRGLYNSWWFCVHKLSMFIYLSMVKTKMVRILEIWVRMSPFSVIILFCFVWKHYLCKLFYYWVPRKLLNYIYFACLSVLFVSNKRLNWSGPNFVFYFTGKVYKWSKSQ